MWVEEEEDEEEEEQEEEETEDNDKKDKARDIQKMSVVGQECGGAGAVRGRGSGKSRQAGGPESGRLTECSEVALSVQSGRERHVVEGSGHTVGAGVRGHAGNAVIRLVWRQLPAQLVG